MKNLLNKLYEKIQTKNICYVILQIGYLKARNSFFNNEYNEDIHYIENLV